MRVATPRAAKLWIIQPICLAHSLMKCIHFRIVYLLMLAVDYDHDCAFQACLGMIDQLLDACYGFCPEPPFWEGVWHWLLWPWSYCISMPGLFGLIVMLCQITSAFIQWWYACELYIVASQYAVQQWGPHMLQDLLTGVHPHLIEPNTVVVACIHMLFNGLWVVACGSIPAVVWQTLESAAATWEHQNRR